MNTPRTHCRNAAGAPRLDPYGAPACADATNIVQERYEAGIAGAGLIVFVGGTLVYRRKRIIRIRSQTRPV